MDNFTPASNERKLWHFNRQFIWRAFPESLTLNCPLVLASREFDLAHLQREWGLSGCRVGEVLLLQEHRGARSLLRTPPHLPSDSGAGGGAGGGLQEQEGRCTPPLYSLKETCTSVTVHVQTHWFCITAHDSLLLVFHWTRNNMTSI